MLLFADWTSQSLTLLALDASGAIADRRSAAIGALSLPGGAHAAALADLAGDWLAQAAGVYVAGMATARGGWADVPYVDAPAGLAQIRAGIVTMQLTSGLDAKLLPGLLRRDGLPDVVRGEELKALGLGEPASWVLLPGRHTKFVAQDRGRISAFRTFLTGELLGYLGSESIVSKLMAADPALSDAGIMAGIAAASEPGSGPLGALFAARSLVLSELLDPKDVRGFLAGVLVASEVSEAVADLGAPKAQVVLIGKDPLNAAYQMALDARGVAVQTEADGLSLAALSVARIHGLP